MLKRILFLFLVIFAGCNNPVPKVNAVKTDSDIKEKTVVKPAANYWIVNSYPQKAGETEGRKYLRFVSDGNFTDAAQTKKYLYAEILFDKKNAGIFLHKISKANPAEKFNHPVQVRMTNSTGKVLQMSPSKSWNSSGGILIERNNNNYSEFRIFLLQSTGNVPVEIRDSGGNTYNFIIWLDGLTDSFSKL